MAMERADGLQVVLGASGGTGRAIVDELVRQGRVVRAVSRHEIAGLPAGVEQVRADLYDAVSVSAAVRGATVVFHAAQPPYDQWPGNFERMNDAVARATGAAGARLVFADNLYMYGPGASPMRETTPQRATDRKGAQRMRLAADLLARHERGEVDVAIGRSWTTSGHMARTRALESGYSGPRSKARQRVSSGAPTSRTR